MNRRISSLAIEAFWIGFGIIASICALLIGTRILTTLLTTAEYGKLSLAVSLGALTVQVCGNPIGQSVIRFYSYSKEKGELMALFYDLKKSLTYVVGGILIVCFLIVLLGKYLPVFSNGYYSLSAGLFAILLVINRVSSSMEDAARYRRFRGLIQGFFEFGRFMCAIGFVLLFESSTAITALCGFIVAALLTIVVHGIFIKNQFEEFIQNKNFEKTRSVNLINKIKRYRSPLIISNACIWIVMMAERWALLTHGNLSDVGGYTAVYQLSFVPMLFVSSFLVLLTEPIIYQMISSDINNPSALMALSVNQYLSMAIMGLTLLLFLFCFHFHPEIASILLGEEFREYSWLFPWLLLAGGCLATAQQLLLKITSGMRTDVLAALWGGIAVFAISSYFFSTKFWHLPGLLISVVSTNCLLVVAVLVIVKRHNLLVRK